MSDLGSHGSSLTTTTQDMEIIPQPANRTDINGSLEQGTMAETKWTIFNWDMSR